MSPSYQTLAATVLTLINNLHQYHQHTIDDTNPLDGDIIIPFHLCQQCTLTSTHLVGLDLDGLVNLVSSDQDPEAQRLRFLENLVDELSALDVWEENKIRAVLHHTRKQDLPATRIYQLLDKSSQDPGPQVTAKPCTCRNPEYPVTGILVGRNIQCQDCGRILERGVL